MPADLPFSPESESGAMEDELARWMTEFQVRPGDIDHYDHDDVYEIASRILEGDPVDNSERVDRISSAVKSIKPREPVMDRLPVLHVTRENLTEVEQRGELPQGFLGELSSTVAEYIDGFMPGQNIEPPEISKFRYEKGSEKAGSYNFRGDRSRVYSKFGNPVEGSSAATVSAHETMHKNNVEAVLEDPQRIRNYAWIYRKEAPEEFRNYVEQKIPVAKVQEDLLGGLGLYFMDTAYDTGVMNAYIQDEREEIEFHELFDLFRYSAEEMKEGYNLEYFDVRDEAICQAVSFFLNGYFQEDFEEKLETKRQHYNESDKYSRRAGDAIKAHMHSMRSEMQQKQGLRGERFKSLMEDRVAFLKGEENFTKY